MSTFTQRKWGVAQAFLAMIVIVAVVWYAHSYVASNTKSVVRVAFNGREIGLVENKKLLEPFSAKLGLNSEGVSSLSGDLNHSSAATELQLTFTEEPAFMPVTNEQQVLEWLQEMVPLAVSDESHELQKEPSVVHILGVGNGTEVDTESDHFVAPLPPATSTATGNEKGQGSGKFAWPVVSPTITNTYGTHIGILHKGIDLVSENKMVLAADSGKVIYADYRKEYGNCVIIDHQNGFRTLYSHLSAMHVAQGAIVAKGDKLGYIGKTGDIPREHLHFEIQRNGNPENPLKYLKR